MTPDNRDTRKAQIEEVAFQLLLEKGYKATSILAVARAAKASNETLYNWYGNKQALFEALVHRNATEARTTLEAALSEDSDLDATLSRLGPILLGLVTSQRAVALNRAAAGDVFDTGTLGAALAKGGRNSILPLLGRLIAKGAPSTSDPTELAEVYIDLLLGDLQIRRAIGTLAPLTPDDIAARAQRAQNLLSRIMQSYRV